MTESVPELAVNVSTELVPDVVPQIAVVWVLAIVSWIWMETELAREAGHCHEPAASSWNPRKCTTRQDATASVGDHEVPAAAVPTSFNSVGTADCSVSALATSWATSSSEGDPANTVRSTPDDHDVQPVAIPTAGVMPHSAAVSPMLQPQVGPGTIPAASTWATNVATEGMGVGVVAGVEATTAVTGVKSVVTVGVAAELPSELVVARAV